MSKRILKSTPRDASPRILTRSLCMRTKAERYSPAIALSGWVIGTSQVPKSGDTQIRNTKTLRIYCVCAIYLRKYAIYANTEIFRKTFLSNGSAYQLVVCHCHAITFLFSQNIAYIAYLERKTGYYLRFCCYANIVRNTHGINWLRISVCLFRTV